MCVCVGCVSLFVCLFVSVVCRPETLRDSRQQHSLRHDSLEVSQVMKTAELGKTSQTRDLDLTRMTTSAFHTFQRKCLEILIRNLWNVAFI